MINNATHSSSCDADVAHKLINHLLSCRAVQLDADNLDDDGRELWTSHTMDDLLVMTGADDVYALMACVAEMSRRGLLTMRSMRIGGAHVASFSVNMEIVKRIGEQVERAA